VPTFTRSIVLPVDVATLAAWHERRGALERLVPPWSGVRVEQSLDAMTEGAIAILSIPLVGRGRIPGRQRWVAKHVDVVPGRQFVDEMVSGPFAAWRHTHRFEPVEHSATESRLVDEIVWRPPLGPFGSLGRGVVESMLDRTFRWRHARTGFDLARHAAMSGTKLVVAVSGASGFVGRALSAFLSTGGHEVRTIVRTRPGARLAPGDIAWDPARGTIDAAGLEGVDAVVHLAGESIASRWTDAKRKAIRDSRVEGTKTLATALATLGARPKVLVSASAVGWYGTRDERIDGRLDERSAAGTGFLAEVCAAWERAADPARAAGIRVVHPRIGMVLAADGGALGQLLDPFTLGLGGPVGTGRQGMSWIALDDLLASILFAITTPSLEGPFNAVAPEPVSNAEFGRTLGRVLRRPAFLPLPGFAVKTLFGAMGEELLLGGAFVVPRALERAGFRFDHPSLESALRFALGR
jgi:uncharacterized protein (TIGR01777 family)